MIKYRMLLLCTALLSLGVACTSEITITSDNGPTDVEQPNDNSGDDNGDNTGNNDDSGSSSDDSGSSSDDSGSSSDDSGSGDDSGSSSDTPSTGERPNYYEGVESWSGTWAEDGASDGVGASADFYHELNTFDNMVVVRYNGDEATVECSNSAILYHIDGGYVTLDMLTNGVSNTEIIALGESHDGGLKIYGDNKFKLSLYGLHLESQRGPSINSQCKKRMFLNLGNGTTNRLADCSSYSLDSYTMPGVVNEDRKGALFAEGNIIVSGSGALVVEGRYKHAIVSDGCYYQRAGVTVAVTDCVKNAIHAKGDADDGTGIHIAGGVIEANVSGVAGKGLKSDMDVVIEGGKLFVTTSGDATYESDENDTSSAAGIKASGNIAISDGEIRLSSSGSGGKGLNSDNAISISGGNISITTTGGKYTYTSSLTSSPKGIKADGNIDISGGKLNVEVSGRSDGSEGMESKSMLNITGGEVVIYAYDDAINAAEGIDIAGGRVFAYASNNDGIDSNGTLTMRGGLLIGVGSNAPEAGVDVDNSRNFVVSGGTIISLGASLQSTPSSSSSQCSVSYGGVSATEGGVVALLDASSQLLFAFEYPRTLSGATLFFTAPYISQGSNYTLASSGTVSDYDDKWMGWYDGGTWSGGTTLTSFTTTGAVTTIGTSGGGHGGGHGGGRPW